MADSPNDLSTLQQNLSDLLSQLSVTDSEHNWNQVTNTAQELANGLRTKDGPIDNHTILGKTSLPKTLSSLFTLALHGSATPHSAYTSPVLEILRVAANLCMDHDGNRASLLDAGLPQALVSLLEAYTESFDPESNSKPLPVSLSHLKVVRTAVGVLLNASVGYDPVKTRLISLGAGSALLKLSVAVYPPGAWVSVSSDVTEELKEEWQIRSMVSGWVWRALVELKESKEEKEEKDEREQSLQSLAAKDIPFLITALAAFTSPHMSTSSKSFSTDPDLFSELLQTDFDALEESCTHIESLSLDVEDVRLSLARGFEHHSENPVGSSLRSILAFIEKGGPSPLWSNAPGDFDAPRKKKALEMCRSAMIKTVVEVAGEDGTEQSLWDDSDGQSGGEFVSIMVGWLKSYVSDMDARNGDFVDRPELATCASLSLGNLTRREKNATILLSPPHSLASILSSRHLLSPLTDIQVKHGVLGLLKHIAQALPPGSEFHDTMGQARLINRICDSGVWDERTDGMAEVLQVSAIGVVKHMCNANVENTFSLVLPSEDETPVPPSGLSQILALVKRANTVTVKSEGTRVLVNVVKSLWSSDIIGTPLTTLTSPIANGTVDTAALAGKERKKQDCMKAVLTMQCANTLASLVGGSAQYPLLVNEGVVALTLLSTQKTGAPLVLKAILAPLSFDTPPPSSADPPSASTSVTTDVSSPTIATPSTRGRLPLSKTPLDMLIAVLKNVDNPVNFQPEVRINVCSLFIQLGRNASGEEFTKVKDTVQPVMDKVLDGLKDAKGKEEMLAKAIKKVLDTWA
ncbi:hypothetical protein GYMLUDRAFT_44346 [Collybiopsis luxurians FD-317 M1]|uniref:ARM repeat-containing protein n=1 Tax=Collybiopsis luxurians FD-317 M1 TaxID=944289 RepID=A0A0D0B8H1_9AGAR|nr:hypothetical protein GYMLUDRAFT_44346 [Collybiopsis luxurians FD-317 M1]